MADIEENSTDIVETTENKDMAESTDNKDTAESDDKKDVTETKDAHKENKSAGAKGLNDTKDITDEMDEDDIANNKAMGILSYLGILVLIPILTAKESEFARFHANQGLVLLISYVVVIFACGILTNIPYLGWMFSIARYLVYVAALIFAIIGIVNANNGKAKELPIIGHLKLIK